MHGHTKLLRKEKERKERFGKFKSMVTHAPSAVAGKTHGQGKGRGGRTIQTVETADGDEDGGLDIEY